VLEIVFLVLIARKGLLQEFDQHVQVFLSEFESLF
jgi:hypothetical protein